MRDLSLHVLDLLENSVRVGATAVYVTVSEQPRRDELLVRIEDDGPGMPRPARALDPFYTTKVGGARVGLGLSLLADAVALTGGRLRLGRSRRGGLLVEARLRLSHIDRMPLGDLAASLSVIACTHPEVELGCRVSRGRRAVGLRLSVLRDQLPPDGRTALAVASRLGERIRVGLSAVGVTA